MNINPSTGNSLTSVHYQEELEVCLRGLLDKICFIALNLPVRPLLRPSSLPHVAHVSAFVGKLKADKTEHTKQKSSSSTFGSGWCVLEVGAQGVWECGRKALVLTGTELKGMELPGMVVSAAVEGA